jgi:hypothetical protein
VESFDGEKVIDEAIYDLVIDPEETTNKLKLRGKDAKLARDRIRETCERRDTKVTLFSYEEEARIMQSLKSLGYA